MAGGRRRDRGRGAGLAEQPRDVRRSGPEDHGPPRRGPLLPPRLRADQGGALAVGRPPPRGAEGSLADAPERGQRAGEGRPQARVHAARGHALGLGLALRAPRPLLRRRAALAPLARRGLPPGLRRARDRHRLRRLRRAAPRGDDQRPDPGGRGQPRGGAEGATRRGRLARGGQAHPRQDARDAAGRARRLRAPALRRSAGDGPRRHARQALRALPDGRRDGALLGDVAGPARALVHPALRGARAARAGARGRPVAHPGGPVGVDEAVPHLAGQPGDLPLARELARPGSPRRRVPLLQGDDERAAPGRPHRRLRRRGVPRLPHQARGRRQAGALRAAPRRGRRRRGRRRDARDRPDVRGQAQALLPPAGGRELDALGRGQARHRGPPPDAGRLERSAPAPVAPRPQAGAARSDRAPFGLAQVVVGEPQAPRRHDLRRHARGHPVGHLAAHPDHGAGDALLERALRRHLAGDQDLGRQRAGDDRRVPARGAEGLRSIPATPRRRARVGGAAPRGRPPGRHAGRAERGLRPLQHAQPARRLPRPPRRRREALREAPLALG